MNLPLAWKTPAIAIQHSGAPSTALPTMLRLAICSEESQAERWL
jgi:hypothetical protein